MDQQLIYDKFGNDFIADQQTFLMGIDKRFSGHFATRFKDMVVLETCTGGGFSTISIAKEAKHVITVEIDSNHRYQAINNVKKSGLFERVSFIQGDIMNQDILNIVPKIDAAFIDPDWAVTGEDHVYRFINSNTQPPADDVLKRIFNLTDNIALILPPFVNISEFKTLPEHECEWCYLGDSHELFCLYFGSLMRTSGTTRFRIP
ncbi:MAG: trimethylguanosine synthase [Desulfobacterales bacterium]|nr:trimethylguanosine synthase [Desulfobacterales bacterium]